MANGESLTSGQDSRARGEEKAEDEDQSQVRSDIAENTNEYQKNMIILLFLFTSTPLDTFWAALSFFENQSHALQ